MTEYEALGIILDMASRGAIDSDDPRLAEQVEAQEEAMDIVYEVYNRLELTLE